MRTENDKDRKMWVYYQEDRPEVFDSTHNRHEKVSKEVEKYLKPKSKILEIGFGDGYLLKLLSKKYDCWGADIDKAIIEKIEKTTSGVKFSVIDTDGKLPVENEYFDGFIASEVLEHMTNEELGVCVSEIERILKRDGYAFVTVPAEETLKENECLCPNCGTVFHKWGHKQYWNENKIRKTFENMDIIKIEKMLVSPGTLNVFGKMEVAAKKIASKLLKKKIKGMTFLVIFKKK